MKKMICRIALLGLLGSLLLPLAGFTDDVRDPLHEEMEVLNRCFRMLKRQYMDNLNTNATAHATVTWETNDWNLATAPELVGAMLKHAEKARALNPPPIATLDAAAQAKYTSVFHKNLDTLTKEIMTLQTLVAGSDKPAIHAQITKIGQLQKTSYTDLAVASGRMQATAPPAPGQSDK